MNRNRFFLPWILILAIGLAGCGENSSATNSGETQGKSEDTLVETEINSLSDNQTVSQSENPTDSDESSINNIDPIVIEVEDLQNSDDKSFCIKGVAWGSKKEDVEKVLNAGYEDEPRLASDVMEIYFSTPDFQILGQTSAVQAEYQNGGLTALTFPLSQVEDPDALYEELCGELTEAFGETEEHDNVYDGVRSRIRVWENEGTEKTIIQVGQNGDSVSIAAGIM